MEDQLNQMAKQESKSFASVQSGCDPAVSHEPDSYGGPILTSRRGFVAGSGLMLAGSCFPRFGFAASVDDRNGWQAEERPSPTFSIEPVVGDGKWISRNPPEEAVGHFDSRTFDVSVGVEVLGTGDTRNFIATTVAPVSMPEQKITSVKIEKDGCDAQLQELSQSAARLVVATSLSKGQVISARAVYRMELSKSYFGYSSDTLSPSMNYPNRLFGQWLGNSPGIQTHSREVKSIAADLKASKEHPFEVAKSIQKWVFENIKGRPMKYTSVSTAIKRGIGDCEERAGTFVALCRAIGIPARLVWVPNHAWAEFCLFDLENKPHWIPAHTAAYDWFGWTGAHELVLQKGDRITLPNNGKKVRLVSDWLTWQGAKPVVRFTASINPVAADQKDPGPGQRQKDKIGRWKLVGDHPDKKYLRR